MSWLCGIPDFEMAQNFVYFEDLRIKRENNSHTGYQRKLSLYNAAASAINRGIMELDTPERIEQAKDFIRTIAERERVKEIRFVQDYCRKMKKQFPFLQGKNFLDRDWIITHADDFYIDLTKAMNEARTTQEKFKQSLQRIENNIDLEKFRKESREEYSADNYLYRLDGDIRSMINKFIGTRRAEVKDEALATKLHAAVATILEKTDIAAQLTEGYSFLAIATAILTDLENRMQEEFDKTRSKKDDKLENITDIETIANNYIKELEENDGLDAVQRALKNIGGSEYQNIVANFINQFGATYLTKASELKQRLNEIASIANRNKRAAKESNTRKHMNKIKAAINNGSQEFIEKLNKVTIDGVDKNTAHGNIAEWIAAVIENNIGTTRTVGKANLADDIIHLRLNVNVGEEITQSDIDKLADKLVQAYQQAINPDFQKGKSHKNVEHEYRMNLLKELNDNIHKLIKELDDKIKATNQDIQLFVFHDSLKEYSSIETGKRDSFSGRTLNILSAWDEIYEALQAAGYNAPADRDTINFLSMHLSNKTVGGGAPKNPIAEYLATFAGLIMFSDVQNMAQEAFNKIEYAQTTAIHCYKLNQVYVPASMVLTFIADSVAQAANMVTQGATTKVKITTNNATHAINQWEQNRSWDGEKYRAAYDWNAVASEVASGTKVHISFMGSFLKLINKLFQS